LAPACADLVAAANALTERAGTVAVERQRLVVAVTRHVADHFLPAWVEAADLVDVRVELVEGDTLAVAHAVRTGAADLGCTDGPAAPLGLRSQLVASEAIVPVVGRRHAWFDRRRTVTGEELVAATLALPPRGSGTLDVVADALAPFGFGEIGDRIEVPSSAAARIAALNGTSVAFLPGCRVAAEVERGALALVATRGVAIEQRVRAVWRGVRPPAGPPRRLLAAMRAS
jgi:DNA-binding transcriptional LysR family regulator